MALTVRFFASLAERLGQRELALEASRAATAREVWQAVVPGEPLPPNTLVAINLEYASPEAAVKDGDQVAFMPPVTGG